MNEGIGHHQWYIHVLLLVPFFSSGESRPFCTCRMPILEPIFSRLPPTNNATPKNVRFYGRPPSAAPFHTQTILSPKSPCPKLSISVSFGSSMCRPSSFLPHFPSIQAVKVSTTNENVPFLPQPPKWLLPCNGSKRGYDGLLVGGRHQKQQPWIGWADAKLIVGDEAGSRGRPAGWFVMGDLHSLHSTPSKNPNGAFGAIKMRKNARAKQRETTTRNQDENENWGRKGRKIGGLPFYVAAGGRIAI